MQPAKLKWLKKKLFDLSNEGDSQGGFTDFATALTSSLSHIEAAYQKDGKISGLPTQLDALDNKTGGLNNSDLIIIAAVRPWVKPLWQPIWLITLPNI